MSDVSGDATHLAVSQAVFALMDSLAPAEWLECDWDVLTSATQAAIVCCGKGGLINIEANQDATSSLLRYRLSAAGEHLKDNSDGIIQACGEGNEKPLKVRPWLEKLPPKSQANEIGAAPEFELPSKPGLEETIGDPTSTTAIVGENAVRAHGRKLFPKGEPTDLDLRDCILRLQTYRSDENTDMEILREFYSQSDNPDAKAKGMAGKIRALRSRGGTDLPPRS